MDMRSLACFVAVAELRHFRKAALQLHMTQPTLSQRIRKLEDEVGTPLFARNRRTVEITEAGIAFLEPARMALANAKLALRQAREAQKGEMGRLRLGFTVIAFYGSLAATVRAFRTQYPDIKIELAERSSPDLEAALLIDDIDIAVLHPPLARKELGTCPLPGERIVLALPASHALADKAVVPMADLSSVPWLIAPRNVGPTFHDRMIAHFQAIGISPNIVQEVTPMTTLVGLVAAGVGMGFVTEGIASAPRPGVVFRPVIPEPPELPLAAAWLGSLPNRSGRLFLDLIASVAATPSIAPAHEVN
jgi:DNA-binding transcriptional LysR family regulator